MRNIKEINIKNRTDDFFDDNINIKNFDLNLLRIDKKSYKNTDIYYTGYITMMDICNPLYLIINEVNEFSNEVNKVNKLIKLIMLMKLIMMLIMLMSIKLMLIMLMLIKLIMKSIMLMKLIMNLIMNLIMKLIKYKVNEVNNYLLIHRRKKWK